ncbi:MAG TPA: hypothetical protein VID29_06495, partial [Solirubrobacteraceae bacterium]
MIRHSIAATAIAIPHEPRRSLVGRSGARGARRRLRGAAIGGITPSDGAGSVEVAVTEAVSQRAAADEQQAGEQED